MEQNSVDGIGRSPLSENALAVSDAGHCGSTAGGITSNEGSSPLQNVQVSVVVVFRE